MSFFNTTPLQKVSKRGMEQAHKIEKPMKKKKKNKPYVYTKPVSEALIDVNALAALSSAVVPRDDEIAETDKVLAQKSAVPQLPADFAARSQKYIANGALDNVNNPSTLASMIVGQNSEQAKYGITVEKYKDRKFPLPASKQELKTRVEPHLALIPRLLAGDEELSVFYTLAHEQQRASPNVRMTSTESFDLPWKEYIAGFYGLARQNFVSSLIQEQHSEILRRCRNKTVQYWSPDLFATYVLANEIIIRLVMEDMSLTQEEGEMLLKETADYGYIVADKVEFKDDLDFAELRSSGESASKSIGVESGAEVE